MKFREFSEFLSRLETTASRNEITQILSDLFKKTSKEEIDKAVYLLTGSLAPAYKGIVFNLAEFATFIGIPVAAGLLYPFTGFLLSPIIAGVAMAFSSVSVVGNSLLMRRYKKTI